MKITAYFYDKYTPESIWISAMLIPLYFIPFYLFYTDNNIILPIVASIILASFSGLIFANTIIEYLVFFIGIGFLLWGSIAMMKPSKKSVLLFLLGIIISILGGIFVFLSRKYIYKRTHIPETDGYINFMDSGLWIWTIIQLILYAYVLYYMYNKV